MFSYDVPVASALSHIDTPFFTAVFYAASWLFNPAPFIVLLALTAWVIWRYYGKKEALVFVIAPIVGFGVAYAIKYLIGAARPLGGRIPAIGPSFPSGHATVATAYFLMLLHFLKQATDRHHFTFRRGVHYAFCIACPLFVGISRLYFGVHWLSDIIAGYIIGAAVVYCVIRYLEFKPQFRKWPHVQGDVHGK